MQGGVPVISRPILLLMYHICRQWRRQQKRMVTMLKMFAGKSPFYRSPTGPVEFIVVGLGNPGKEYEMTRHNAGFLSVDYFAQKNGFRIDKLKFKSLWGDCMVGGKRVLFLKPSTFMNLSGQAVTEAAAFYKVPMERVLVVMDDISLEPGKMRIRRKGSDGGHNGIKNIIYLSGSDQFPRIKVGVGAKPNPNYDLAAWVPSRFTSQEQQGLEEVFPKVAQSIELIVAGKIDQAMNQFNSCCLMCDA